MFMTFDNQESRREKYGSAFLELSYCKLEKNASVKKKLKIQNLPHWQNDSLYVFVDDLEKFYNEYLKVFNLAENDIYGIKYFSAEDANKIILLLNKEKPTEYEICVKWLNFAINNNGFYILGI